MASFWSRGLQLFGITALVAAAATAGCGGGDHGNSFAGPSGDDGGSSSDSSTSGEGGDDGGDGGGLIGNNPTIASISVSPPSASITSVNGKSAKQAFTVVAHYTDGTTGTLGSGVSWMQDSPLVGALDAAGTYTASGSLGGVVHVSATYKTQKASAMLTVKLLLQQNPGNVSPGTQTSLQGAKTPDPALVWAYPYDGTVWPRGLLPPILQWNGGAATDDYYVHIVGPTFELQQFTTATNAPTSRIALDPTTWDQYTNSSAGPTTISVSRWDGMAATVVTSQTWTIAPASMRGTIYYWSNNLGRVLRIKPGAAMPDDFANQAPLNDTTQYPASSCLMTCHTVSADGSTIVSGGGAYGGSYDLKTSMPMYSLGGTWGPSAGGASSSSVVRWMMPAVSPDGKYILTNSMAEGLAYANDMATTGFLGLYDTTSGMGIATSGVQNVPIGQPAWSPEGSKVVYVDLGDPMSGWYASWNNPPPGDLKVMPFDATKNPMFGAPTTLVPTGSDTNHRISWPTVTPDGKWVLYSRAGGADTRTVPDPSVPSGPSDLYFASTITPNQEVRLAKVDGDGYPFAAGARDQSWNFEPSFAPVATGGYFWVVFTSRRTYGNILTGPAEGAGGTAVKQLWIAAIEQNPKAGADPEPRRHPPDRPGREQPRDARLLRAPPVRAERTGLRVGHRLLRRLLRQRRRRRRPGVPVDALRLLAERRQVQRNQRLLRRIGRSDVHQSCLLGAHAAVNVWVRRSHMGVTLVVFVDDGATWASLRLVSLALARLRSADMRAAIRAGGARRSPHTPQREG